MLELLVLRHLLLAASGGGCPRSAALGFLQVLSRPPSPALGHPRDREEAPDLLPVEGVDAENIADGEIVVGTLNDLNLIARPHFAHDTMRAHLGALLATMGITP